jgi:para-aminobenzoate synthetase/4-amino-4-deoxychorismate lyase
MKYALFEDVFNSGEANSYLFTDPIENICVTDYTKVAEALLKVEALSASGYYLAGYLAYDAIFALETKLAETSTKPELTTPLLHFVAFATCQQFAGQDLTLILKQHNLPFNSEDLPIIEELELTDSFTAYAHKFNQVQEHLINGNSYQINLTTRAKILFKDIDALSLYYQLSRTKPVEYAALLPFSPQKIVSLSPELFFTKVADKITTKPMKGTAPRGANLKVDQSNYEWLKSDSKNLAENLIIVDLLRNDLAKFCDSGSVTVEELFQVEKFATLMQMTSQIAAKLPVDTHISKILTALFPCGSITGAPKLRTMQTINAVEQTPRGIYCGAIGFILPNNDMHFSVAIRTLTKSSQDSHYTIGAGGGVTVQSDVTQEWQEIKTKLKFIRNFYQPDFCLIESMLYANGEVHNSTQHLERLRDSAEKLLFNVDTVLVSQGIYSYLTDNKHIFEADNRYKLRVAVDSLGKINISHSPVLGIGAPLKIGLLGKKINTTSCLFQHKTDSLRVRGLYDQLYLDYKPIELDELIFVNQDNIITESRYFNVLIEVDGRLLTSPISAGLLPGIYRKNLLDQGVLFEQPITIAMLEQASRIYLYNDVRGLISCELVGRI